MENQDQRADASKAANAKIGFFIHLLVYLLVNAGLVAINLLASPERIWFVWPLAGWSIGVLFHALAVFVFRKGCRVKEWMITREMHKQNAHHS